MKFTKYSTTKEFVEDTLGVLKKYEIQNNLFFKNIETGLKKDKDSTLSSEMLMTTIKDNNGNVLITAMRTIPHPFVIFETDNIPNDDALEFLTASLAENNINIDKVIGEKELVKRFCESYGKHIGKSFSHHESLVLYLLEKIDDLDLVDGNFRKANETDMYYLPYWCADFAPACKLGEYNLEGGIEGAKHRIAEGTAYIFENNGLPVSLAVNTRKTSDCAIIAMVYTPPTLRGKGYSTACVAKLSQKLFDDGWKYCALYANCENPYSNRVYQKIGYKEIFYYDQYKIEE